MYRKRAPGKNGDGNSWSPSEKEFIGATLAANRLQTLALLTDNLVLDNYGFPLRPETLAVTDDFAVEADSRGPVPMVRNDHNGAGEVTGGSDGVLLSRSSVSCL